MWWKGASRNMSSVRYHHMVTKGTWTMSSVEPHYIVTRGYEVGWPHFPVCPRTISFSHKFLWHTQHAPMFICSKFRKLTALFSAKCSVELTQCQSKFQKAVLLKKKKKPVKFILKCVWWNKRIRRWNNLWKESKLGRQVPHDSKHCKPVITNTRQYHVQKTQTKGTHWKRTQRPTHTHGNNWFQTKM